MSSINEVRGQAAAIRFENLDTDQIMPKQFLRGIDKKGLDKGLLYDLRCFPDGRRRTDFVLNRPEYQGVDILIGGNNFGCGSSREHAVWGLQQFGIQAVIAPSFGEIFYSNAMNNRLLLVMLPEPEVRRLMEEADNLAGPITISLQDMRVRSATVDAPFEMSPRHRRMFMEGLDVIGLTLTQRDSILTFSEQRWKDQPWLKDIAKHAREHAAG